MEVTVKQDPFVMSNEFPQVEGWRRLKEMVVGRSYPESLTGLGRNQTGV